MELSESQSLAESVVDWAAMVRSDLEYIGYMFLVQARCVIRLCERTHVHVKFKESEKETLASDDEANDETDPDPPG